MKKTKNILVTVGIIAGVFALSLFIPYFSLAGSLGEKYNFIGHLASFFLFVSALCYLGTLIESAQGPKKLTKAEGLFVINNPQKVLNIDVVLLHRLSAAITFETLKGVKSWYYPIPFVKIKGYLLTGFKTKWPDRSEKNEDKSIFNLSDDGPTIPVFVSEKLILEIQKAAKVTCLLRVTHYGNVKMTDTDYGEILVFAAFADCIVSEYDAIQASRIDSINAIVLGTD